MTKTPLSDHRTKALGLIDEASLAVKKVCLEYGVPKPPPEPQRPPTITKRKKAALEKWESWMPNIVLDALAKYIALDELESRTHKERLRLLKVLSNGCERVSEALEKLSDYDRRQIRLRYRNEHERPPATGGDVNFDFDVRALATGQDIDFERFRLEALVIGIYTQQLLDEAQPDKHINPQRVLIKTLYDEWLKARSDKPTAYPTSHDESDDYGGKFYQFVRDVMKGAGLKPPHGHTVKAVLLMLNEGK